MEIHSFPCSHQTPYSMCPSHYPHHFLTCLCMDTCFHSNIWPWLLIWLQTQNEDLYFQTRCLELLGGSPYHWFLFGTQLGYEIVVNHCRRSAHTSRRQGGDWSGQHWRVTPICLSLKLMSFVRGVCCRSKGSDEALIEKFRFRACNINSLRNKQLRNKN